MNNLITNFPAILEFASKDVVPITKKRGVIREYLQSLFISRLYALKGSAQLIFVGGTSMRLLRNLPRFSENLDFDALKITDKEIVKLFQKVVESFKKEAIPTQLDKKVSENKSYFSLKFPTLLHELGISSNPREKLMIKLDYSRQWKAHHPQTLLFSKYGLLEQVRTNSLDQLLVQKLSAYVNRKTTQPRDIFDITWLYAQGARMDLEFAKANKLENIALLAKTKHDHEGVSSMMKQKLSPFLFQPNMVEKMNLAGDVLASLV